MLEVTDVHTYYGESHVLHGVSLTVGRGEAVALLGRNGVGKSTLIRTIVGFTPARRGAVRLDGRDITRLPPHAIARLGVGLVPQGRRIFAPLSVRENLLLAARAGDGMRQRVFELFPRLRERLAQGGGSLSGGEQAMLAIARALMTGPAVLLLDEPSEGLAPLLVRELGRTFSHLKAEGMAILLVEQNVPLALRVADRVYVMSKGRIVYHDNPERLDADTEVKRRYLGIS